MQPAELCLNPCPPSEGPGVEHRCGTVVVNGGGSRVVPLAGRSPEAYQEPPGTAKAERKRHGVSLGGPRRTLVRRSCPTDEGPVPLRPATCRRQRRRAAPVTACPTLRAAVGHCLGWVSAG
ncbi:hypothetical protein GCM10010193_56170 [Kitasatospora atroaurantiaca]